MWKCAEVWIRMEEGIQYVLYVTQYWKQVGREGSMSAKSSKWFMWVIALTYRAGYIYKGRGEDGEGRHNSKTCVYTSPIQMHPWHMCNIHTVFLVSVHKLVCNFYKFANFTAWKKVVRGGKESQPSSQTHDLHSNADFQPWEPPIRITILHLQSP